MKNVKDAKFIESLISQNDLKSFVCSNRDDLKLFLDEVCYSTTLITVIAFSHRTIIIIFNLCIKLIFTLCCSSTGIIH